MSQMLETQLKSLELLSHLTSYTDSVVMVSGPAGSGKTFLANMLTAQRELPEETCLITADPSTSMAAVLSAIANHLNMPAVYDDTLLSHNMILDEARLKKEDGSDVLIIIDQADCVDDDTLVKLVDFAYASQGLLSIALFGRSGFEQVSQQANSELSIHPHYLSPLEKDEALTLLTEELGSEAVASLSEKSLKKLYASSGGWPGQLLAQANALLEGKKELGGRFSRFLPITNILAVAVIATGLILLMLYKDKESAHKESAQDGDPNTGLSDNLSVAERADDQSVSSGQNPPPILETTDIKTLEVASVGSGNVAQDKESLTKEPSQTVNTRDESSEKEYNQQNYASLMEENPETKIQPEESISSATASDSIPESAPVASASSKTYAGDGAKLLLYTEGFVIQLMGSSSLSGAEKFKSQWQPKVAGQLFLYQTSLNNKDWFVVVDGVYASRDQANSVKKKLPATLLSSSPWVRPLAQVHDSIR